MEIETASATWAVVKSHCEADIERARRALEMTGTSPVETEFQRGRIAALRSVLSLSKPVPQVGSWHGV